MFYQLLQEGCWNLCLMALSISPRTFLFFSPWKLHILPKSVSQWFILLLSSSSCISTTYSEFNLSPGQKQSFTPGAREDARRPHTWAPPGPRTLHTQRPTCARQHILAPPAPHALPPLRSPAHQWTTTDTPADAPWLQPSAQGHCGPPTTLPAGGPGGRLGKRGRCEFVGGPSQ